MKARSDKITLTMIDKHLRETDDPEKAIMLKVNEVEVPTWNEMSMQMYKVRDTLGTVEDLQKILFVAGIIINAVLTIVLLLVK